LEKSEGKLADGDERMYVNLNEKFLERTKKKAKEKSISESGDDGKDNLMYEEINENIVIDEITDEHILVSIDSDLGYISFEIPLTADVLEDLLGMVIKKMNKIKTLIESLK